jgi:hypothetical protein
MHLAADGTVVRTDIWREGKYLDLWSVPHFLSGMLVGIALRYIGLATLPAFVIALILLIAYEFFEYCADIEEMFTNSVMDVVVGMVSFTPTFLLFPTISANNALMLFTFTAILDAILSWFGWQASHKAYVFEKKVRAEIEKQRERMREGGEKLKRRLGQDHGTWHKRQTSA